MIKRENLKQKAASGMMWAALQKYTTMFIQFISGIVLARLLTPYDYGCIGMLMIFIVLAESFIDGGFGSALIQKKQPTQEDYSTIFFWNLAMAMLLYLVLFLSAPAIARFYKIPLLCSVLRVQGIILFIYAFNIVQKNQLQKRINFKAISIVTITASIIALIVTIFMAINGFGVWSLVMQYLLSAAIPAIVFWFYLRWRPQWVFSWNSFKELFSFGFYMFLTHLVNNFSTQIQGLLIGKVYTPSIMGYYSKAMGTEKLASHSISGVLSQVTYPLFAEVQDDKRALGNMIKRIISTVSYITFPFLLLLALLAKPIFVILYSDRWIPSVPYFQVLCIAGMIACLQSANLQAIAAIGESKQMLIWTLVKRGIGMCFIVIGLLLWGMKGLLAGIVLLNVIAYVVNMGLVNKYIGYDWKHQINDFLPQAIISSISAVVSYGIAHFFNLAIYFDSVLKLVVFLIIYLGWSFLFKPQSFIYFLSIMPKKMKNERL